MHVVRRGDSGLTLFVDIGDSVDYDFEIVAPLSKGGEVLMGRTLNVFVGEVGTVADAEIRIFISHDFGVTFQDRGTVDIVAAAGVFFGTFDAIGTNMRVNVVPDPLAVGLSVTLNTELHLT